MNYDVTNSLSPHRRVLAQVTCEVTEPRATRINEGLLQINVDISTMCSPDEEIEEMLELKSYVMFAYIG